MPTRAMTVLLCILLPPLLPACDVDPACPSGYIAYDSLCGEPLSVCVSETSYRYYEPRPCWWHSDGKFHGHGPGCCSGTRCLDMGIRECPAGHTCVPEAGGMNGDKCLPCDACVPDCTGRQCGQDGCGGTCGTCEGAARFCVDGQCVMGDPPMCDGKMCGADGMGGSCGSCPDGWECTGGLCSPVGGGCGDLGTEGRCVNGWAVTCVRGKSQHDDCPYKACRFSSGSGHVSCQTPLCLSDCFGKTCGDDGCGASCGKCSSEENCDEDSVCLRNSYLQYQCDPSYSSPFCLGHTLVNCQNNKWVLTPCLEQGLICGPSGCGGLPTCRPVWPGTFSCGNLPKYGHCEGKLFFNCVDGFLSVRDCSADGPFTCGRTGLDELGCR